MNRSPAATAGKPRNAGVPSSQPAGPGRRLQQEARGGGGGGAKGRGEEGEEACSEISSAWWGAGGGKRDRLPPSLAGLPAPHAPTPPHTNT